LGVNVQIGPFCVVEAHVRIGDNCLLHPHVMVFSHTTLGANCEVFPGAVLGGKAQDIKAGDEVTYLKIGEHNIIREYVTLHRATGEGEATIIGDHNMFMAYCHVGHNCRIGSHVMIANSCGISGHVVVEDRVVIGGMTGIHQFVSIGTLAMVGGYSKVTQDVPPFTMVEGRPTKVYGLNVVGLRRNGISAERRAELKQAYRLLYRSKLNTTQAIERIKAEIPDSEELRYLVDFVRRAREGRAGRQRDKH